MHCKKILDVWSIEARENAEREMFQTNDNKTESLNKEQGMLNVGDKIYYLDYEDSHSSYTIVQIEEISNDEYIRDGYYYHVHPDSLPNGVGYYLVPAEQVDTNNIKDRYYSSPEKAHEAYKRFKEWRKKNSKSKR